MPQVAESGAHVIATARELDQSPGLQSLLEKYGDKGPLQILKLDISDVKSIKVRLGGGRMEWCELKGQSPLKWRRAGGCLLSADDVCP